MKEAAILFIITDRMNEFISLDHGSGGKLTGTLIEEVFTGRFGIDKPLTDSAIINDSGIIMAYTTDSFVVNPLFFPGGNIGKLAVCGTVNDLAVSGAVPRYISASFIIEEGFPLQDLTLIVDSMAEEARAAGIRIVAGDTKVVEKGKCDKLFITTSGTAILDPVNDHISTGRKVRPGDKLIINGSLGNHAIAVLVARNQLSLKSPVISDCASLNQLIRNVLDKVKSVHFMRDITRGGLATILNELSSITGNGIEIDEASIPVDEPVRGLCEMLGFDPLYLANEGKILWVVGEEDHKELLNIARSHPLGTGSAVIGEIVTGKSKGVILNTSVGGKRILNMLSGMQIPRIC